MFSFSLSLSCLLPGRWNSSGKTGRGLSAMKRRIRRAYALIRLEAWHAAGRDAIHADDGLLGLAGSEWDVGGAGTRTTPGGNTGAARQPARFVAIAGRRGEAILSDKLSVMLRLGDASVGKADAVPDFQQGLHRSSIRQGRYFGAVRPFFTRGAFQNVLVGRRRQKSPPCGGLRYSRLRTGFRDCPREGARSCL